MFRYIFSLSPSVRQASERWRRIQEELKKINMVSKYKGTSFLLDELRWASNVKHDELKILFGINWTIHPYWIWPKWRRILPHMWNAKGMGYKFTIMCFSLNFFQHQKNLKWEGKEGETFFVIKQTFQSFTRYTLSRHFIHILFVFKLIIFFWLFFTRSLCLMLLGKKKK